MTAAYGAAWRRRTANLVRSASITKATSTNPALPQSKEIIMTKTLTRVYSDYASADLTVRELKNAGLGDSHIGIVASNAEGWHKPGGGDVDPKHDKDRDGKEIGRAHV